MNLLDAYAMGSNLEYISRVCSFEVKVPVKGEKFVVDTLERIHNDLKKYSLSKSTQYEIAEMIKIFKDGYKEKEPLTPKNALKLTEDVKLWADRIVHELYERKVVEVFTDGTLNAKKLISGGESFFVENIWDRLSDISKSDLNDACNCLLIKSWTPAVMISLRASEDCIRKFYMIKTGNDPHGKGWGYILDKLNTIPGIDKTLVGYLNYIREIRNTAGHPDKIFDQREAEGLFHQVVDLITQINLNNLKNPNSL